jgi:hypothetical protein
MMKAKRGVKRRPDRRERIRDRPLIMRQDVAKPSAVTPGRENYVLYFNYLSDMCAIGVAATHGDTGGVIVRSKKSMLQCTICSPI